MAPSSSTSPPAAPGPDRLPRWHGYAALTLAAVAGAAVMVVELGVARVLTPVFGGSISVWAIVIATTMLALAAGYAFGGWRADLSGGLVVARRAALLGALLCAAVPFLRAPLIEATVDLDTLLGAALASLVLIAPAQFFLSQVSPALIRALAAGGGVHVGLTAGGIYAVSTVGSLVGTLGAVWAFLYAPLSVGFVGTGLLLAAAAAPLRPAPAGAAVVLLLSALGAALYLETRPVEATSPRGDRCTLVEKRQSAYGVLRVVDQEPGYRYLVVNGTDQGGIDLRTGRSAYDYDEALIGLARLYAARLESALIIGLGPGVMAQALLEAGVDVDVVEIDAEVLRLSREFFGYRGGAEIDDGRRYLARSGKRWDAIFVDAFLGANPPWQLYTAEAFGLYRRHLSEGGAVVLNFIGSHLDPAQRPALEAVTATARAVFPHVDVYPDPWEPDDYPTRNLFVAASDQPRRGPLQAGDPREAPTLSDALARSEPLALDLRGARVLRDDSAPLAPLVRPTTEILRSRLREYLPLEVVTR